MRILSKSVVIAALTMVVVASPTGASTLSSHAKPTGDAATIALYAKAVNTINSLPAVTEVTHDYYFYAYTSPQQWRLAWGTPAAPAANEHRVDLTAELRVVRGRTVSAIDTFATPCATTSPCTSTQPPLEIYVTKAASYWTVLVGPKRTPQCWTRAGGATSWLRSDFTVGEFVWYVGNSPGYSEPDYRPMVRHGNNVAITSSYVYQKTGLKITEADTINTKTSLFTHTVYHVGATPTSKPDTYTIAVLKPGSVPKSPSIDLCA